MYDQTVQVRPRLAGARDSRGNVSYTYPESGWYPLEGVSVAPAFSNETDSKSRQNEVVTGLEVYSRDNDVAVKSYDRVWYQGEEWQVTGRVARWGLGSMFRLQAVSDLA